MKVQSLLLLLWHHVASGQMQYESFVGCFKDNGKRDFRTMKKGNLKKGNAIEECRKWAKSQKKKYFALQIAEQCFADNDYGTPWKDYFQLPVSKCVRKGWRCGNGEHKSYCGGGWANAVYKTEPIIDIQVKEGAAMQLVTPDRMASYCWLANPKTRWLEINVCSQLNYVKAETKLFSMKNGKITTPSMKGQCLDYNGGNGARNIVLHKCHNGLNQKWYWADGATLKNKKDKKKCVTWTGASQLKLQAPCTQDENQNFWWNTGKSIQISKGVSGNRKFLSSNNRGTKIDLFHMDDGSGRQHWKFEKVLGTDTYNIKLTNGIWADRGGKINLDNAYLSCNQDGSVVDIWGQGLGKRQRWKVKKVKDGFNIMVAGDVKGKRKYLSTTQDGKKVDLWIKDDGSGRQVWKLHVSQIPVPTPKPTPVPTPRPTPVPVRNLKKAGGFKVIKGYPKCTISIEDGADFPCAVSPNYGKIYGREIDCVFELKGKKQEFVTLYGSTEKYFDPITVSGKQYSGKLTAKNIPVKGNIKWTADFYEGTKGWKICRTRKPPMKVIMKPKKGKGRGKGKK